MEFFHFCNGLCYNWQEAITLNSFHIIPFYWVVWSLFSIKDLKEFRNGFFFCPNAFLAWPLGAISAGRQYLEQKLIYKAKQNQSSVIKVDPRYTSQCCPVCGHTEQANRNKKIHLFTCKNCGYKSNDDRIGAMNLYRMGINYLYDSQVPDTVVAE